MVACILPYMTVASLRKINNIHMSTAITTTAINNISSVNEGSDNNIIIAKIPKRLFFKLKIVL